MMRCAFLLSFIAAVLFAVPADASEPRKLTWEDLVPKAKPVKNPLDALTPEQRDAFDEIEWSRRLGARIRPQDRAAMLKDAKTAEYRLAKQGINVERLLAEYRDMQREIAKQESALVGTLNGRTIRMPGYLLPLELSEKGSSEFLLVPYVGACIHVPPPPPNQIVFVKLKHLIKTDELFEPVWVTGRMRTKSSQRNLALVDGSSKISVGYTLEGQKIEIYKEK